MNLESTVLSERGRFQQAASCMSPYVWKVQNRSSRVRTGGSEEIRGLSFEGNEEVLELQSGDSSDGCRAFWVY